MYICLWVYIYICLCVYVYITLWGCRHMVVELRFRLCHLAYSTSKSLRVAGFTIVCNKTLQPQNFNSVWWNWVYPHPWWLYPYSTVKYVPNHVSDTGRIRVNPQLRIYPQTQMDTRIDKLIDSQTDAWVDEWKNGWRDRWTDTWDDDMWYYDTWYHDTWILWLPLHRPICCICQSKDMSRSFVDFTTNVHIDKFLIVNVHRTIRIYGYDDFTYIRVDFAFRKPRVRNK